jgi:hypothetical protein
MKNAVFWDIKTHFVPHRRHIMSPLQSPAGQCYVRFGVITAVSMKNAIFWNVTPCVSCRSDISEECMAPVIRVKRINELGTALAVTSNRSTLFLARRFSSL